MSGYIEDHVARAKSLVTSVFEGSQTLLALLAVFVQELQEAEDAYWDLAMSLLIEHSRNAVLDQVGSWLGEQRGGLTDLEYQRLLAGKALVLRSDASPSLLLELGKRLSGSEEVELEVLRRSLILTYVATPDELRDMYRARFKALFISATRPGWHVQIIEAPRGYFGFEDDPEAQPLDDGCLAFLL